MNPIPIRVMGYSFTIQTAHNQAYFSYTPNAVTFPKGKISLKKGPYGKFFQIDPCFKTAGQTYPLAMIDAKSYPRSVGLFRHACKRDYVNEVLEIIFS